MKEYFKTDLGVLYHGDCVDVIEELVKNGIYIDLVVTSPPYDGLRDYEGYNFDFEKTADSLSKSLSKGGVIVWIVSDQTINGSETGTSFKQALYFKNIGLNIHDTMIWCKKSFSNPDNVRYYNTFEYMFVLSNGQPKFISLIKDRRNINSGERTNSSHRIKDGSLVTIKKKIKVQAIGVRFNVWEIFPYLQRNEGFNHPAVFPKKLAADHILSWSDEGYLVLDPFAGSGTTLIMAERFKRRWIGIEISEKYCEIAKKRIQKEFAQKQLF